jgi:hypothetical protein
MATPPFIRCLVNLPIIYSIGMKKSALMQDFLAEIKKLNGGNKVTLIAGYNGTDL